MRTLGFLAVIVLLAPFLLADGEFKPFQSLLPKGSAAPAGYLIVQVPESRKAPADWDVQWFVSAYTQKGYRLPLGTIEDQQTLGPESKLAFRLPLGQFQIEITRKSGQWSSPTPCVYLIDDGRYQCDPPESVFVAKVTVPIRKDAVKIVNLNYEDPQTSVDSQNKDHRTATYTWRTFSLSVSDGSAANLPPQQPETYPLVEGGDLDGIDQARLVQALKHGSQFVAAVVLLHCKEPAADLLLSALKDKSLKLDGPIPLILAKAHDQSAAPALIQILQEGPGNARPLAAWALGELGAEGAVDSLIHALDGPLVLRNHAAFALAKIKDPRAIQGLIKAAQDKSCLEGTTFAMQKPELQLRFLLNSQNNTLSLDLPAPSNCIQENALYALGQIQSDSARDYLLKSLSDPDAVVRRRAIFPVANFDDARVIDALISQLNSGEEATRWMTVNALARLRAQKAEALLSQMAASDPAPLVKAAAADAVKKLKEPKRPKPIPARTTPRTALIVAVVLMLGVVAASVFLWAKKSLRKRSPSPESGTR